MRVLPCFVIDRAPGANCPWCVAPARASLRGGSPLGAMGFNASRQGSGSPTPARAHVARGRLDSVADRFVEFQVSVRHASLRDSVAVMIADGTISPRRDARPAAAD